MRGHGKRSSRCWKIQTPPCRALEPHRASGFDGADTLALAVHGAAVPLQVQVMLVSPVGSGSLRAVPLAGTLPVFCTLRA